ncbi:MAG: hypothetical protein CMA09_05240 [Euryarchaeota archaeon]|nr:hypothetical protein [Euryarchaeota archaeon]|tara:strand:- start:489 stop:1070 length:582 start_codon:yes stop_codon:yes gene_type:complete
MPAPIMADSPVSVHQGSGTLAQAVLSTAPEGMLIAPAWKRAAAYMLDVVLLTLVLHLLTGQTLMYYLMNYSLITQGAEYVAGVAVNWALFFGSHYLYFKYTGRTFGRSFAQRGFRIAVVHDNGTLLEQHHWGPRAFGKLIYLIPVVGILWFGMRDFLRGRSKDAEYRTSLDIKNHTVAAVDWSLPSETRLRLR